MGEAEFQALKADIAKHGQREPVWTWRDQIIDGRHRVRACDELGHLCLRREYEGDESTLVQFVVSLNLHRRHLNESQRAMVAGRLANLGDGQRKVPSPIGEPQSAVTQGEAAAMLNVGKRSVERAREVIDNGAPELVQAVERGEVSVSAAATIAEIDKPLQVEIVARGETEILQAAKKIRAEKSAAVQSRNDEARRAAASLPAPTGLYRSIVIDPPWAIEINDRDVRPGQVGMHYPTMTNAEIAKIALPMADECIVWMWTTQKFLPSALEILNGWGLKYLFTMTWHKPGGPQPFGLPQYNSEFIVVARRGGQPFIDTKAFPTCFQAPRREHSRKPDEFYDLVSRVTAGPRIDWFSREKREGFDQFGNDTGKFDEAA